MSLPSTKSKISSGAKIARSPSTFANIYPGSMIVWSPSTKAKLPSVADKKLLDDTLLKGVTAGGSTITPLYKVYKPQPKLTYLDKKLSPELCCESSSSKAKISSVAEKKLLDDYDKLRETVKILANKFTSIEESKLYKPEPLLNSLELKRSPELCCESSSSKAKISSVVEKKLLDDELFHEKLRKALKLQVWSTRPLCPDDYIVMEPELYKPQLKLTSLEKKRSRKLCEICSTVHSRWDMSALESCAVCHCVRHLSSNCPLLVKFTVVCCCGCPFFDIDEWVCRAKYCVLKKAMLKEKVCELCEALHDHTTYECPEAKDIAAEYKMLDERVHEVEASKRCKERFM